MNDGTCKTRPLPLTPLVATALCSLLLSACGSDDDAAAPVVTAQQACASLSGKTIAGATLAAVSVPASGAVPTYCQVNGNIAPALNFEMRLPDAWNGKLYYGGGGGYNGSIPPVVGSALSQSVRWRHRPRTGLQLGGIHGRVQPHRQGAGRPRGTFSTAKTALLAKHVRDACDGLDGLIDGIVSNPAACTPAVANVAALRCAGGADTGDTCLSDAQLAVVTSWTTDAVFTGSGTFRNAGWNLTGNEDDPGAWAVWETGGGNVAGALQFLFQDTTVKNYLARDPSANSLTYAPWDQNQNALYALAALNDATNTDIRPFINSGGKLIVWHGGNDAALSVNSTAEYVANMRNAVGATNADASTRFYLAPGVDHCAGGPGADSSDLLTALDQWVTKGTAPGTLTAEKRDVAGALTFARPLCQHPQYARYTGPLNDAAAAKLPANYTCTTP